MLILPREFYDNKFFAMNVDGKGKKNLHVHLQTMIQANITIQFMLVYTYNVNENNEISQELTRNS